MKAYKLEVLVIDFDDLGQAGVVSELENGKFGNDCISPRVLSVESADIGQWSDDHPLNKASTHAVVDAFFDPNAPRDGDVFLGYAIRFDDGAYFKGLGMSGIDGAELWGSQSIAAFECRWLSHNPKVVRIFTRDGRRIDHGE